MTALRVQVPPTLLAPREVAAAPEAGDGLVERIADILPPVVAPDRVELWPDDEQVAFHDLADTPDRGAMLDKMRRVKAARRVLEASGLAEVTAERDRYEAAAMEELERVEHLHAAADRLAYAIAPMEVIGEHSSANNPWANAVDEARRQAADHARVAAERDQLAAALARMDAVMDAEISARVDAEAQRDLAAAELAASAEARDRAVNALRRIVAADQLRPSEMARIAREALTSTFALDGSDR